MIDIKQGQMVVDPRGAIGLVSDIDERGRTKVQYGASGPFVHWAKSSLRWATREEIAKAGLSGVGREASPVDDLSTPHAATVKRFRS